MCEVLISLQVVKNVYSRDQLGRKLGVRMLEDHFLKMFGDPGGDKYTEAVRHFVRSVAAYGVVCYLLWVKVRDV